MLTQFRMLKDKKLTLSIIWCKYCEVNTSNFNAGP